VLSHRGERAPHGFRRVKPALRDASHPFSRGEHMVAAICFFSGDLGMGEAIAVACWMARTDLNRVLSFDSAIGATTHSFPPATTPQRQPAHVEVLLRMKLTATRPYAPGVAKTAAAGFETNAHSRAGGGLDLTTRSIAVFAKSTTLARNSGGPLAPVGFLIIQNHSWRLLHDNRPNVGVSLTGQELVSLREWRGLDETAIRLGGGAENGIAGVVIQNVSAGVDQEGRNGAAWLPIE